MNCGRKSACELCVYKHGMFSVHFKIHSSVLVIRCKLFRAVVHEPNLFQTTSYSEPDVEKNNSKLNQKISRKNKAVANVTDYADTDNTFQRCK